MQEAHRFSDKRQWLPEQLNQHTSDRTALVWQDGSLSFAQLHQQSLHWAGWLGQHQGVGPGQAVAILYPNERSFVLADGVDSGVLTPDLGGSASTATLGAAIASRITSA